VHVAGGSVTGQHLLPVVQVSADLQTQARFGADLDGTVAGAYDEQAHQLGRILVDVASGRHTPRALANGNVGFQVTRGLLGTSM